jgi:hypothetical protein
MSVFKKQRSHFTTFWPEYLLLLWWWVYTRSRGHTLPHIGLNTCYSFDYECIQEVEDLLYHILDWILALLWWWVYPRSYGPTVFCHILACTCSSCADECIQEAVVLLYHALAWIRAPAMLMSVSKKQRFHFTTYWPEYLLLLWWCVYPRSSEWPTLPRNGLNTCLLGLWWKVCSQSSGPTLPHISPNTCHAPAVMMSVSKKQWSYFATYWPGYLLLLHVRHVMISLSKKQWFHFTTHWHEYLFLLWWWVYPRSRGSTLPHIGLNSCSSCVDESIQETVSYFASYWPEYLLLLWWLVYPRSRGLTLRYIGLDTFFFF